MSTTEAIDQREYQRKYREANKEKRAAANKAWRDANKEAINARRAAYREANREKIRERSRDYYKNRPEIFVLHNIRTRAKQQGVPCTLTVEDIATATPEYCPVLGIRLERSTNPKGGVADNAPTVDRLIPSLGYVKDNIIVVSHKANRIKNNATVEELETVAHFYKALFQVIEIRKRNDS